MDVGKNRECHDQITARVSRAQGVTRSRYKLFIVCLLSKRCMLGSQVEDQETIKVIATMRSPGLKRTSFVLLLTQLSHKKLTSWNRKVRRLSKVLLWKKKELGRCWTHTEKTGLYSELQVLLEQLVRMLMQLNMTNMYEMDVCTWRIQTWRTILYEWSDWLNKSYGSNNQASGLRVQETLDTDLAIPGLKGQSRTPGSLQKICIRFLLGVFEESLVYAEKVPNSNTQATGNHYCGNHRPRHAGQDMGSDQLQFG